MHPLIGGRTPQRLAFVQHEGVVERNGETRKRKYEHGDSGPFHGRCSIGFPQQQGCSFVIVRHIDEDQEVKKFPLRYPMRRDLCNRMEKEHVSLMSLGRWRMTIGSITPARVGGRKLRREWVPFRPLRAPPKSLPPSLISPRFSTTFAASARSSGTCQRTAAESCTATVPARLHHEAPRLSEAGTNCDTQCTCVCERTYLRRGPLPACRRRPQTADFPFSPEGDERTRPGVAGRRDRTTWARWFSRSLAVRRTSQ